MAGTSIPVMHAFGRFRGMDAIAAAHDLVPLLKVRTLHAVLVTLLIVAQYWFELASGLSDRQRLLIDVFLRLFTQNVMFWIVGFAIIAVVPGMTIMVIPFLLVYGVSYFFTEFGPNMTTFVMPSELYPVTMRATGHGISAGVGKLGAFIGVFLFPVLQTSLGLRGTLLLTAAVSVLGFALTLVLPEPAGRSLEDMAISPRDTATMPLPVASQTSAP